MDIVLVILATVFLIVAFLGCVLPVLPGLPIAYVGLLLLHFTDYADYSTSFLVLWGVVVIIIQVLDAVVPAWGTKRLGGTKWGMWGSTLGVVVGLFLGPWGIILGPFLGAVVGELLHGKETSVALKSGFGSFVGFLFGTIAKLIIVGFFIYYYIVALI